MTIDLQQVPHRSTTQVHPAEDNCLDETAVNRLQELGISRRRFMSYCAGLASLMALPPSMVPRLAAAATSPTKPSVVYLSFQECTGCLESLVNSFAFRGGATIDNLILNLISLDYQETLMAAAGTQAEDQLLSATSTKNGYVLVVDGSVPAQWDSGYYVSAGRSGVARFRDAAEKAALVLAVGTCASFGGLPKADPNPTGAISISDLMIDQGISVPLINVPGCPPIPEVITGVILYYLTSGKPPLDDQFRPTPFYGKTVHSTCYRKEAFEEARFTEAFDDAGAHQGHCLLRLGCKGPVTHNACSTIKWNQGTSFPMQSGHGCIGCAEPDFWDRVNLFSEKGFYVPLADGADGYDGHGGNAECSSCHGTGSEGGHGGGAPCTSCHGSGGSGPRVSPDHGKGASCTSCHGSGDTGGGGGDDDDEDHDGDDRDSDDDGKRGERGEGGGSDGRHGHDD
jgi:hydrogenase small subunit